LFQTVCLLALLKGFSRVHARIESKISDIRNHFQSNREMGELFCHLNFFPLVWFVFDEVIVSRKAWLATLAASILNYTAHSLSKKIVE